MGHPETRYKSLDEHIRIAQKRNALDSLKLAVQHLREASYHYAQAGDEENATWAASLAEGIREETIR